MSLLGTPVYANPDTPLWLSSQGGVVTGNVTFEKAVYSGTGFVTYAGGGLGGFEILDPSGNAQVFRLAATTGVSPRSIIQSANPIYFNQIGTANGNTSLTLSAFGANADLLSVGGTVAARNLDLLDTTGAAVIGTATLAAGSAIISSTASDVTSYIFLTRTDLNASTAVGELRITNKSASTFTVNSVDATGTVETGDLSSFDWVIINAA
jgi:hypothetical protein